MPSKQPRLLIVATEVRPATENLTRALTEIGFATMLVHPKGATLRPEGTATGRIPASVWNFRRTVERAIERLAPDMVVTTDAGATHHLHALHTLHLGRPGAVSALIARTIENSLGDAFSYQLTSNNLAFARFNRHHQLPMPSAVEVVDEAALRSLLESVPLPVMLKAANARGGTTVVRDMASGIAAYRRMSRVRGPLAYFTRRSEVLLQQHIEGTSVASAAVARNGRVLACLHVEKSELNTERFIHHAGMDRVVFFVANTLKISGFIGFDFTVEERTGSLFLTGVNHYATEISHLVTDTEIDLVASLYRSFAGSGARTRAVFDDNVVALFARARAHTPDHRLLGVEIPDPGNDYPAPLRNFVMSPADVVAKTGRNVAGRLANIVRKN